MLNDFDDEQTVDEELAPMVDGLSGALCIFILIATVFMISGINTVVTGIGKTYIGKNSRVDYFRNTIYFDKVLSISNEDYTRINESIRANGKQGITFEAYDPGVNGISPVRIKRDLTYNLFQIKEYLDVSDLVVTLKISDYDICESKSSCIKWSVN